MEELERKVEELVKGGLLSLREKDVAGHARAEGTYFPSYLGLCLRKQYYIYTVGERMAPENLAVLMTGESIHELVARAFRETARVEDVEQRVELNFGDVRLSGRLDVLLADVEGRRAVIEVKSASKIPRAPYESHVLQLQVYLHALGVDDGFVLYWDKHYGEIKAFHVQRDEGARTKVFIRVKRLDIYIRSGTLPPPEAFESGHAWECEWCPYKERCAVLNKQTPPHDEVI